MTPVLIIKFAALMLWCYVAVLAVAWFRAVGGEDRRHHVGHFVSLMGVFVPLSCALVFLIFLGGMLGLPSVVALLFVLVPAGLVVGLQLEVTRIAATSERIEGLRLMATLALAAAVIYWRGGL